MESSLLLFKAHLAQQEQQQHAGYLQAMLPGAMLVALCLLVDASPAHAEGGEEFFGNVARYGRYFVTVMLGTGYVILRPIVDMFKNPFSAILAIVLVTGAVVGTKVTLDAMLGLDFQVEYQSTNFM
jgi:hypothetical protein